MNLYDKLYNMNTAFGIWHYNKSLRITYVAQGWLVVWDHQQSPPMRYDFHYDTHQEACASAVDKLHELVIS